MNTQPREHKILDFSFFIVGIIFIINFFALYLFDVENIGVFMQGTLGVFLVILPSVRKKALLTPKYCKVRKFIFVIIIIGTICYSALLVPMVYNGIAKSYVDTEYLLILGARVRGEKISLPLKLRLDKGYDYLTQYPNTKVIVSGGQGPGEDITEALAMKRYLEAKGINEKRIIMEDKSTSTFENIKFTREIIDKIDNTEKKTICIVTNDYHMFRSKMLASRNNFDPVGIPCSTYWQSYISSYLRESIAFIKSFLLDK
ncbi:YdcF family protein [Clostridium sp. 'deep sea']|uniref:YdcF family protein n=1 Tax=Clostridium sp. 'deep sea' TaxID=2779445 RepID=UPI0018969694|nr:YdcF family protein [Clostridium sp. 'deep sea']QOR36129.1 YdcF family protein [Clostridium sp. 'deep sea']